MRAIIIYQCIECIPAACRPPTLHWSQVCKMVTIFLCSNTQVFLHCLYFRQPVSHFPQGCRRVLVSLVLVWEDRWVQEVAQDCNQLPPLENFCMLSFQLPVRWMSLYMHWYSPHCQSTGHWWDAQFCLASHRTSQGMKWHLAQEMQHEKCDCIQYVNGLNMYSMHYGIHMMLRIQAACRWQWHHFLPILTLLSVPICCHNRLLLFHQNQNVLQSDECYHCCNLTKWSNIIFLT